MTVLEKSLVILIRDESHLSSNGIRVTQYPTARKIPPITADLKRIPHHCGICCTATI